MIDADGPKFRAPPSVALNPNPRAPLAAILRVACDRPVAVKAHITDGVASTLVEWPMNGEPERALPVVGLKPDRIHLIRVTIADEFGAQASSGPIEYRTPPLPAGQTNFPQITLVKKDVARMEGGITILTVRRRMIGRAVYQTPKQRDWVTKWSMLIGVDENGEVVWTYHSDARIAGIEVLENGNIFFHTVAFRSVEIDMLGNEIRSFYALRRPQGPAKNSIPVDAASIHHQPHAMPNGNFLAMTANAREFPDYYTSEADPAVPRGAKKVVGDRIIEFTPDGKEVWSWNAFDHLDPYRIGYFTFEPYWHTRGFPHHVDWSHGNGVTYDPATDCVIMSLKHQSAVIAVDKSSGNIRWIIGNAKGWSQALREKVLKPVGLFQQNWNQHNPRVTNRGTILLYDNGAAAAMPFDPPKMPHETFSRAVEFEVDEANMTVRQVWTSAHEMNEDSVMCWAMGDAHELPRTGNVLVIDSMVASKRDDMQWDEWDRSKLHPNDFPYWVRIREYTRTTPPEVVWELHSGDPDEIMSWEFFGGARVASLWKGAGARLVE